MQVLVFRSKHKNSAMKHTVTLYYLTINMVGFLNIYGATVVLVMEKGAKSLSFILLEALSKQITGVLPYYSYRFDEICASMGGRFFRTRGPGRKDISNT